MRLTRRDALAALAGAGAAGVAGCAAPRATEEAPERLGPDATATLVAAAEVLYPSQVEGVETFVDTYVGARTREAPRRRVGIETATGDLDDAARAWHDARFGALSVERRESVLRELGADTATPDPEAATPSGRVRFYVVNELLYALYTSPAGGRLVGAENPVGHPGGTTSYRQGPR